MEQLATIKHNEVFWFVVRTTVANKETDIKGAIDGILPTVEDELRCFVPMKKVVVRKRNQNQKTFVPAIKKMVFIKGTMGEVAHLIRHEKLQEYGLTLKYLHKHHHGDMMLDADVMKVRIKPMQAFINFICSSIDTIDVFRPEEIEWREGDKVSFLMNGQEYEGEIVRIKGKRAKQFAIIIPGLACATVALKAGEVKARLDHYTEAPREYTETPRERAHRLAEEMKEANAKRDWERYAHIDRRMARDDRDDRKSKNREADRKLLNDTAKKLLFGSYPNGGLGIEMQGADKTETERAMKRLATFQMPVAEAEAELALAMFLGAMATGKDTETYTIRLKAAIDALKKSSMMRLRAMFYYAKLTDDREMMEQVLGTVRGWNRWRLQRKQIEFKRDTQDISPMSEIFKR